MRNKDLVRRIAQERMFVLLSLAEKRAKENTDLGRLLEKRYVELARKISRHYLIPFPKNLKKRVCKKCNNFLIPGINCKVRLSSSERFIIYKCECGAETKIHY